MACQRIAAVVRWAVAQREVVAADQADSCPLTGAYSRPVGVRPCWALVHLAVASSCLAVEAAAAEEEVPVPLEVPVEEAAAVAVDPTADQAWRRSTRRLPIQDHLGGLPLVGGHHQRADLAVVLAWVDRHTG